MIDRNHKLSISRQAKLLGISRGSVYYLPQGASQANQVWALDTTYIPMRQGFVYLTALVDVASRRVLAHRVALTLEACHAREVLLEALAPNWPRRSRGDRHCYGSRPRRTR